MDTNVEIDVATLDSPHRLALEEVLGQRLALNQRLIIHVAQAEPSDAAQPPAQTLDDWTRVYDGLSEEEIEAIDEVAKTRANLTRNLP